MDIRKITDTYSVAPQLLASEMQGVADAGFRTVICNRPDAEIPPPEHMSEIRKAAEAAGLTFLEHPIISGGMTMDDVTRQGALLDQAEAPVLAYCRSGTRCTFVWALAMAGQMPVDEIEAAAARGGYDVSPLRAKIISLAG